MNQHTFSGENLLTTARPSRAEASLVQGVGAWLRRASSIGFVLLGLGAFAYWGHRTDWRFISPTGTQERSDEIEHSPWSAEGFPPEESTSWCEKHQLVDCPHCRPAFAQILKVPNFGESDQARIDRAMSARSRGSAGAICQRLPRRIRFSSKAAVDKTGIATYPVWENSLTESIAASGEVSFDSARVARLSTRTPGTAWWVGVQVGDRVEAGELLALVDAADVGKAKAELIQAVVHLRLKQQIRDNIRTAPVAESLRIELNATLRDAEIRLQSALQVLSNLGLSLQKTELEALSIDTLVEHLQTLGVSKEWLKKNGKVALPSTLAPLRASLSGIVVKVDVLMGESVDPAKVLFTIVDPKVLWVNLYVTPEEAAWVRVGQKVEFQPDGRKEAIVGQVSRVAKTSDETTRTIRVQADVANPKGKVLASTLGVGRIILREEPRAIVVPKEAVHTLHGCQLVFVPDKNYFTDPNATVFHVRQVYVGASQGENLEIIAGVLVGETVVAKGSTLLLDELRRTRLSPQH